MCMCICRWQRRRPLARVRRRARAREGVLVGALPRRRQRGIRAAVPPAGIRKGAPGDHAALPAGTVPLRLPRTRALAQPPLFLTHLPLMLAFRWVSTVRRCAEPIDHRAAAPRPRQRRPRHGPAHRPAVLPAVAARRRRRRRPRPQIVPRPAGPQGGGRPARAHLGVLPRDRLHRPCRCAVVPPVHAPAHAPIKPLCSASYGRILHPNNSNSAHQTLNIS